MLDKHFNNFEIYLTLIGGFIISIGVGALIYLLQLARSRITAVEEAKKQLEKMKRDLLFTLDVAQIGTWVWNKEENHLSLDSVAKNMLGITGAKVRNLEEFLQIIDPQDRETVAKNIQISLESKAPYTCTFRVVWKDSSTHYIISKGRLYSDEHGKSSQLAGVCWDITEIKRSQQFLELSEEVIRTLNESVSFSDAASKICKIFHRAFGWEVLVIWLRDKRNGLLHVLEISYQPELEIFEFENIIRNLIISQEDTIANHIFSKRSPIWFKDFSSVPSRDKLSRNAKITGLKGAFATPIFEGSNVIGILELFKREPFVDEIDYRFLSMMTSIGIDLGQFIAQKIAQHDQEQLAAIVTYSTDGIFSTDLDGVIKSWNSGAERIYGWSESEIIGKNVTILVPSEKQTEFQELKTRLRGVEKSFELRETQRIKKDGSLIWVANTYSGIKDHKGDFISVSIIVHDITEQKNAIDLLQKSEEKFRTFVETTEEWIWEIDKNSRFTYSNPSIKKILGFTQKEIEGKELFSFIAEDQRELLRNEMQKSIKTKTGWTQRVYPYKDVNGQICYLESNSEPIFDDLKQLIGFRGADRDVTNRMNLEKSQNEFISIVSHELRTPLTAIHGALGLVISDEKLSPRTKELMSIAYRNSERLRSLINDILNIERIQFGKLDLKLKFCDVAEIIKEAILSTNSMAKSYKILILEEGDLPAAKVKADPERLIQVLINLLSNAIKFSLENSKVFVSAKIINNHVRISIKDEGIGIPEEFKPKIFQRFARADSSNSRSTEGTGLGLSISKSLIELMGGEIGFTSEKDKGSMFYLTLPCSFEG